MTTDDAIGVLAREILDQEADHVSLVHALKPVMAPMLHADLCEALELCPMHGCDAQICADDDDRECEKGTKRP